MKHYLLYTARPFKSIFQNPNMKKYRILKVAILVEFSLLVPPSSGVIHLLVTPVNRQQESCFAPYMASAQQVIVRLRTLLAACLAGHGARKMPGM